MFIHNLKYSFKTLFRNKMLIFWTFAFPIILATFFSMAFSNIENSEKLDIIDIAIVDNDSFKANNTMVGTFKKLGDKNNDEQLFSIKYTNIDKAKKMLNDKKVSGYLLVEDNKSKVVVKQSGINETILKHVVEKINQTEDIMNNIVSYKLESIGTYQTGNLNDLYANIYEEIEDIISVDNSNIKNISNNNLSYTMIEFYTLIAMTCLYGGILGMTAINQNLADMSNKGKRISISPTTKGKIILSSVCASYITQIIGIALLFIYTIFILKIDYGTNLVLVILLALSGSLAGLSMGITIATIVKSNENMKTGLIISVTMLGCFLSGMMGITMKYIIDKNVPIVNIINPANMITDGLYSLYYYDTLNRYFFNVISLLIFSGIMIFIAFIYLRRQKYDSI